MLAGLLYTLGRMLTYLVLGTLVVAGLLSIPGVSDFLQKYMNQIPGPLLILVGMVLLELIKIHLPAFGADEKVNQRAEKDGVWEAGLLGILFALSFCPVSAALFFGSLIPLAVQQQSRLVLPSLFGLGTGLPVIAFAAALAFNAHSVGRLLDRMSQFEKNARRITGGIFIAVGVYYSLVYIFHLL